MLDYPQTDYRVRQAGLIVGMYLIICGVILRTFSRKMVFEI
ncbi:hypothetical protein DCF50_p631 [Dehalobacter sp. CF]|nr:hypothetical protein DCF50_p631 [Dehalobacter sp. CF]